MSFADRFQLVLPLIQAPMAGVSTPLLAASVSESGGLGSIGVGATDAAGAGVMIEQVRGRTARAFNVNLFVHGHAKPDAAREAVWLDGFASLFDEFGAKPPERLRTIYRSFADDPDMLAMLLELCREHTRLYPNDARAWAELARTLTVLALYEEALAAVDRAQDLCSEAAKPAAWEIRGSLWEERGDFDQAARCYAESLALRPVAWMYNVAGRLEWQRGDLRAAERLLRQGTTFEPEPDEDPGLCWDSLISVLWALECYDEALQACVKAIQLDPECRHARQRFEDLHAALAARSVLHQQT